MSLDQRTSALIKRIYSAREDSRQWEAVADEILSCTGAAAALTTVADLSNCEYSAWRFYGPGDTSFARGYEEYQDYYTIDPTLSWASENPSARFCDSSRTVPDDEYLSHPFVRWYRARFKSTHWYVGYTPPEDRFTYSFSLLFPAEQGAGSPASLRLFRMLFDHMDCAHRLSSRPFNPESSRPILLLDSGGTVRGISDGAELALAVPDGLQIKQGRLSAAIPAEQHALDAALLKAASVTSTGAARVAVKISRPSGQRPWILTVRPLLSGFGPFGRVKCELLVQVHDGTRKVGSLDIVQSLFDLTGRETEVVALLMQGHSVESLAQHMSISSNTARTHLRAIFAKTQTSRQSELLQLCAGLATG